MPQLYTLYEHATGFAIFRTTEFEEIAVFLPQVRQSITDISKFRSIVYLVAFQPFKQQKDAVSNMKSIAADELNIDLQLFLENNIPRTKKSKQAVVLGVEEPNLATVISDKLGINCSTSGVVKEIIRGIRFHFHKLIKGFKEVNYANKAQLALAHHYSREKVNFDARRQDCMVIESNTLIEELDKDIRILTRRIREWYSLHFPELCKIIPGDELYVLCVHVIGDRKNMAEGLKETLHILIQDSSKVEAILTAAQNSMGMEISLVDLENMNLFCERVFSLIKKRQESVEYLKAKMKENAPNMSALVGEMVASRLISRAGGLTKLAKLPASTIQILGADKKLFRSVKGAQKPITCGLISGSAFMGKAGKTKKGHLARILANKCSLASRVDCFSRKSDNTFGSTLTKSVQDIIRLHKRFKSDIDKKDLKTVSFDGKEKAKNKKSKRTKMTSRTSVCNSIDSVNDCNSIDSVNDSEKNLEENAFRGDAVCNEEMEITKEVSLESKTVESPAKSITKLTNTKSQKKRKSKANKSLVTENAEKEASEMQTDEIEEEKPLKRSKRLADRKSMGT